MKKSQILFKIKKIGTPKEIAGMFLTTQTFLKNHKLAHPKPKAWDQKVFVWFNEQSYLFEHRKIRSVEMIPAVANVIFLDEETSIALAKKLGIEVSNPKKLLRQLLQLENLKQYRTFLELVDNGFKTNMTFLELSKLAGK